MLFCQRREDAVDRGAHRDTAASQFAIDLGRPEIGRNPGRFEEVEILEQAHDATEAGTAAQTLQDLRHDESAGAEDVLTAEQLRDLLCGRRRVAVQELDPGGAVDQDPHGRTGRRWRSSSKFPSHWNLPRSERYPSSRRRRAYSRSASLITPVLLLPGETASASCIAMSSRFRVVR